MKVDDQLAQRFVCSKCGRRAGRTRRLAATGTGLSKLFDIQHNKFIAVSCSNCGFTEFYDPGVLEKQSHLGDVLDVLFGS